MTLADRLRRLDDRVLPQPPVVDEADWMSEADAAIQLGISVERLRAAPVAVAAVRRARTATGTVGVTRSWVEAEREWRRTGTVTNRVRRAASVIAACLPLPLPWLNRN